MAMYGIDTKNNWDTCPCLARNGSKFINQALPFLGAGAFIAIRPRIAARQKGAQGIFGKVRWRDRTNVGLDQLTNFLFNTHTRQKGINGCFGLAIGDCCRACRTRPIGGIGHRRWRRVIGRRSGCGTRMAFGRHTGCKHAYRQKQWLFQQHFPHQFFFCERSQISLTGDVSVSRDGGEGIFFTLDNKAQAHKAKKDNKANSA